MQPLNTNKEKCSVVISSFSAYRDVWEPFFKLFFKYWPDCPYDIYLITDKYIYEDRRVKTIQIKEDLGWSKNTRYALQQIDTPYFIMFMEDFLMTSKVDTERILKLFEYVIKQNIDYLRLYPSPGPDKNFNKEMKIGEISQNAKYRLSLMAAIWRKDTFLELLNDEETIWQMELIGSERSRDPKYRFLSVDKKYPAVEYFPSTAIKKGVWRYDAVAFCKKEGIVINRNLRRVETYGEYVKRRLMRLQFVGGVFRRLFKS
jgi:hypothetical protein